MSAGLPLWYGQERGTDLVALVDWEEDEVEARGGDRVVPGILGLVVPPALVALVVAFANVPPVGAVLLAMAGAAWLAGGLVASWLVAFSEWGAPQWAQAMVAVLVGIGQIIAFAAFLASLLAAAMVVIGIVGAILSWDRR